MELATKNRILAGFTEAIHECVQTANAGKVELPFEARFEIHLLRGHDGVITDCNKAEELIANRIIDLLTLAGRSNLQLSSAIVEVMLYRERKAKLITEPNESQPLSGS